MSWEFKCKSGIQIESGTTTNVGAGAKSICEKDYIWNPAACSCIYPSWYFLNNGLQFQPNVYNTGKDLFMIFMNLSDKAILNIKSTICCCIVSGININCVVLLWCKWCHVVAISSYHYCTDD